jgi:hypothetical protein
VRITARGLAAWYAGSASSAALRRAGLLDGDRAAAPPSMRSPPARARRGSGMRSDERL